MTSRQFPAKFGALVLTALFVGSAGAETIVEYRGDAPNRLSSHYQSIAIFATDLATTGSNLGSLTGSADLGGSIIAAPANGNTTLAAAIANDQFFTFTVEMPVTGTRTLLAIAFSAASQNIFGNGWAIRSSLDNFASTTASGLIFTASPTLWPYSGTVGYIANVEQKPTVTFRIYVFGNSDLDSIIFDSIRVERVEIPTSAPIVEVSGSRRIRTSKRSVTIRGFAFDDFGITGVTYRVGKSTRTARGTTNWAAKVRLKKSQKVTRVKIEATDADGNTAAPRIVKIIRD